MSWQIEVPEALNEVFIATDQDYARDVLVACIKSFLLNHPDAGPFRDYGKEEERNLYISGVYKQDIRYMPQVTVDVQLDSANPMAIGDVAWATSETITTIFSQTAAFNLGIYALTLDENRLIQSVLTYGFTNKWFRFTLYRYGLYLLPNTIRTTSVTTTSFVPEKMLYRSSISIKLWMQIQQEVSKKVGPEIADVIPVPEAQGP